MIGRIKRLTISIKIRTGDKIIGDLWGIKWEKTIEKILKKLNTLIESQKDSLIKNNKLSWEVGAKLKLISDKKLKSIIINKKQIKRGNLFLNQE